MNGRQTRKRIAKHVRLLVRPRAWWCPQWLYLLAARLVLRKTGA